MLRFGGQEAPGSTRARCFGLTLGLHWPGSQIYAQERMAMVLVVQRVCAVGGGGGETPGSHRWRSHHGLRWPRQEVEEAAASPCFSSLLPRRCSRPCQKEIIPNNWRLSVGGAPRAVAEAPRTRAEALRSNFGASLDEKGAGFPAPLK